MTISQKRNKSWNLACCSRFSSSAVRLKKSGGRLASRRAWLGNSTLRPRSSIAWKHRLILDTGTPNSGKLHDVSPRVEVALADARLRMKIRHFESQLWLMSKMLHVIKLKFWGISTWLHWPRHWKTVQLLAEVLDFATVSQRQIRQKTPRKVYYNSNYECLMVIKATNTGVQPKNSHFPLTKFLLLRNSRPRHNLLTHSLPTKLDPFPLSSTRRKLNVAFK